MGRLKVQSDYELRKARIIENQSRLASLGRKKTLSELQALSSTPKSEKSHVRKYCKVYCGANTLRCSAQLRGKSTQSEGKLSYQKSSNGNANGLIVRTKRGFRRRQISQEALRWPCEIKCRGILHDPVYGICCHFFRQKKLRGEEDCKRRGDLDMDQACIGETDCSNCHYSVLCRACLKIRYGEEMEEVRSNNGCAFTVWKTKESNLTGYATAHSV